MEPAGRKRYLFLVELWREPSSAGGAAPLRGIVKQVAHDAERYIVRLADVTSFMAQCINDAPPADEAP
jgi:hypothetical protein